MSTESNKAFIREYLAAISGKPKTPELIDRFVADEELKKHIIASETAFPRYRIDPDELIAEGDLVSVRATARCVHGGPFQGLPATGKEIKFGVFLTYRVSGGKIVEHWMLLDSLSMAQQLGLMPAPAAAH